VEIDVDAQDGVFSSGGRDSILDRRDDDSHGAPVMKSPVC